MIVYFVVPFSRACAFGRLLSSRAFAVLTSCMHRWHQPGGVNSYTKYIYKKKNVPVLVPMMRLVAACGCRDAVQVEAHSGVRGLLKSLRKRLSYLDESPSAGRWWPKSEAGVTMVSEVLSLARQVN